MVLPTPQTHPEFPLWRLGYTPEQVYDLFFPQEFRFLCNPNRPAVCGRFGLPEDRLWRFEFVVQGGEDGMQMATPEKVKDIVYPYIIHAGSHYGYFNRSTRLVNPETDLMCKVFLKMFGIRMIASKCYDPDPSGSPHGVATNGPRTGSYYAAMLPTFFHPVSPHLLLTASVA